MYLNLCVYRTCVRRTMCRTNVYKYSLTTVHGYLSKSNFGLHINEVNTYNT